MLFLNRKILRFTVYIGTGINQFFDIPNSRKFKHVEGSYFISKVKLYAVLQTNLK